jgi:hypothetical protein
LDKFSEGSDDVHHVVAFVENDINLFASLLKLTSHTSVNDCVHEIWMWLVTNFEDVLSRYILKSTDCGLEVVESISHITLSCED